MISGKGFLGYALLGCILIGISLDLALNYEVPDEVYVQKNTTILNELRASGFDIIPLPNNEGTNPSNLASSTLKAKTAFYEENGKESVYYYVVGGKWFKLIAINPNPSYRLFGVEILSGKDDAAYVIVNESTIEYRTGSDIIITSVFSAFSIFMVLMLLMLIGQWRGYIEKDDDECGCC